MLARRLLARARAARAREYAVSVSHIANSQYSPPLPNPDGSSNPEWDGMLSIGPDGAPIWSPRQHNGIATRVFAPIDRAPPGSIPQGTISLPRSLGGWASFRATAAGIDPTALETFAYGQTGEWARHLVGTATNNSDNANYTGGQSLRVRDARTGTEELVSDPNRRWLNNGDVFIGVEEMPNHGGVMWPPSIRYDRQGFPHTWIGPAVGSILELPTEGQPRLGTVKRIDGIGSVETKTVDFHIEAFDDDDVLIRKSTTFQSGLGTIVENTSRHGGRHFSIATLILVDVRRTPFGEPLDFQGRSNRECTLKIRVNRLTGLLTVLPSGDLKFDAIRRERYALDQLAWYKEIEGNRLFAGYTIAGTNSWPTLPTDIPLTTIDDGPIPSVARPIVMSDRVIQVASGQVRAWAFDGTYLGAYPIPSGVTGVTKLDRTDLLIANNRWTSRDRGATWQQYAAGQRVFTGFHTSVCLI